LRGFSVILNGGQSSTATDGMTACVAAEHSTETRLSAQPPYTMKVTDYLRGKKNRTRLDCMSGKNICGIEIWITQQRITQLHALCF
jgi:hypothetical protein